MSRTKITNTTSSVGTDGGATLFSFIQGEQLEFRVTLNFLAALSGYTFEAVVMEALNTQGDSSVPTSVKPGGVNTTLVVRIPEEKGLWNDQHTYSKTDVVLYLGKYYIRKNGTEVLSSVTPDASPDWELYTPNKIYIRFPDTLASDWSVQPTPGAPVYGYFELRVTEPNSDFPQTFKPMRGVVEINFSPTQLVN
jgi:hypothetical protein